MFHSSHSSYRDQYGPASYRIRKILQDLYLCSNSTNPVIYNSGSAYGKHFRKINDYEDIDRITSSIILDVSIKNVRYSQNPLLCVFSYHTLAEREVNNIAHIIEGIKYGLSSDDILKTLMKGES